MQLNEVVREFGQIAGFQSLKTNENGVVHITIHKIGDLFIDEKYSYESGNYIFIYLLRVYEQIDGALYGRALKLCDYKRNEKFLVNPVLRGDQALGFAVKWPLDTFDVNILQEIIRKLQDLHDRIESIG